MTPIRVVLSNGEHDEHELAVCNQGVTLELVLSMTFVVDIASGQPIATQSSEGWHWGRDIGPYERIFFHGVETPILERHPLDYEGGISSRAYNALRRAGFEELEEISEYRKSWMIMFIPGFGQRSADEVHLALNAIGLDYTEET